MTKTIVLVHGAWLNSRAWEHWKTRYEAKGYTGHRPDWPADEGDPVDLKRQSASGIDEVRPQRKSSRIMSATSARCRNRRS